MANKKTFLENVFLTIGFTVMAAVMGFSMISCSGGGKTIRSIAEFEAYLNKQPANDSEHPYKITLDVYDLTGYKDVLNKEIKTLLT